MAFGSYVLVSTFTAGGIIAANLGRLEEFIPGGLFGTGKVSGTLLGGPLPHFSLGLSLGSGTGLFLAALLGSLLLGVEIGKSLGSGTLKAISGDLGVSKASTKATKENTASNGNEQREIREGRIRGHFFH